MGLDYDFSNKTALISGAGSGIGRSAAMEFARFGASVIAVGRTKIGVDETVDAIKKNGGIAFAAYADVSDRHTAESSITEALEQHGELDIAINCAGVFPPPAPLAALDPQVWDDTVGTNLTGLYNAMRTEIQSMKRNGGGVIVNASSNIGAHSHRPGLGAYIASKAGVSALTAVAALDYVSEGIRINAVSPGAAATRMSFRPGETEADRADRLSGTVPIGRVGEVEEIVNAILWLASDESSFVVGQDVVVDGGMTA